MHLVKRLEIRSNPPFLSLFVFPLPPGTDFPAAGRAWEACGSNRPELEALETPEE